MDNSRFTDEARAEAFRQESMQQLIRQTKAIESIKTYVSIWFWVTAAGMVLLLLTLVTASSSRY